MVSMREILAGRPGSYDLDAEHAPKYVILGRYLRVCIQRGEIPDGQPVDFIALAAHYGVSIGTARHAVDALYARGYVAEDEVSVRLGGKRFRFRHPPAAAGEDGRDHR